MWIPENLSWRRALFWLTVFIVASVLGLGAFIVTGVYNVSAAVGHFDMTKRIIEFVLARSITTHGGGEAPPFIDDDRELARLGARYFAIGCAPCHSNPSISRNPLADAMLPAPPSLDRAATKWQPGELAWIIENGLKFTGMPSWTGEDRRDEVWAMVAYLRQKPEIDAEAGTSVDHETGYPFRLAPVRLRGELSPAFCMTCHGDSDTPPVSAIVPALGGQTAAYLRRSLQEFRGDRRQSGMMEPIAAVLDDAEIARLADFFSGRHTPRRSVRAEGMAGGVAHGRRIATRGSGPDVPPCLACHSGDAAVAFPRLRGLSREYILAQLRLFRAGTRSDTAYAAIMRMVALRLTPAQMEDVATYFAATTAGETARSSAE